ncbi:MAG: hypothetical protein ACXABI_05160 [Candidatus Hodarchaeales archaeon]|jgi:hypothetical protein
MITTSEKEVESMEQKKTKRKLSEREKRFKRYLKKEELSLTDSIVSNCSDCIHFGDCRGMENSSIKLNKDSYAWKTGMRNVHCVKWRKLPDISNVLTNTNLISVIQKEFDVMGVVNEEKNRLIVFYVFIGPLLLEEPPGIIFLGSSSTGKSYLTNSSMVNFPEAYETVSYKDEEGRERLETHWKDDFGYIDFNEMTTASLYRIGLKNKYYFSNKLLILPELPQKPSEEQIRVQQLIRILISEGKVSKNLTLDGKPLLIELRGHPAFISADAELKADNQLMNRTLLLNPDEGFNQTKSILLKQGELEAKPWLQDTVMKTSHILSRIYPELQAYKVLNLWGPEVSNFMCDISQDPQLRRTNKLILKFIRLRTLLFQKQRPFVRRKEHMTEKFLLTSRDDVIETINLLSETIQQTLTRVMETALDYLDDIKNTKNDSFWMLVGETAHERYEPKEFTYSEFATFRKTHYKSVYAHLKSLVNSGLLILDNTKRPHRLKLNIERKSPENFLGFLRENLKQHFPEKELLEGVEYTSRSSSPEEVSPPISNEDRELLTEEGEV